MPHILAFSSSFLTLKFSIHNFFKTKIILKIFDAEFPYKLSYFEPLFLLAKMAAKIVKRPIWSKGVLIVTRLCFAAKLGGNYIDFI